jgi:P pilus assembly chaperone PapD
VIAFNEWGALFKDLIIKNVSLRNRIKYLYKPPGWKHDGTGKLSADLKEEWLKEN